MKSKKTHKRQVKEVSVYYLLEYFSSENVRVYNNNIGKLM